MVERKPAGMSFESWVDKQIREAEERGDFDNLPGAGEPLPSRGRRVEENQWLRDHIEREGLSTEALLPTSLRLRKEVERLPETVRELRTEKAVREHVAELNERIARWLRSGEGPLVRLAPVDVDETVRQWRQSRD